MHNGKDHNNNMYLIGIDQSCHIYLIGKTTCSMGKTIAVIFVS